MPMRSTAFEAIVSPRGSGALGKRRPKGALAKFAEGGSVDYTDPDQTISALNRSLDVLTVPPSGQGKDLSALGFAAGILSPTRSGSYLESLGSGYRGELGAIETDRDRAMRTAQLRMSVPTTGLQAAGLAQNLQQQKMYLDAIRDSMSDTPGAAPTIGVTAAGKPTVAPAPGNIPPPISAGVGAPQPATPPIVAGAPVNPGAAPGTAGSTLTAPPDQAGASLVPITAPASPTPAPTAAPAATMPNIGANGMTVPSDPNAQPVPAQIAQQYATIFNRMSKLARNPLTAELATKYNEMLKGLTQPGFAFLPDGSGIVPIGDKAPDYLRAAKAANELLIPDGKGGYTNAPGVVSAAATKAGAVKGAEANAQVGAHNAEAAYKAQLDTKKEQDTQAYKTFTETGVWPPGYGPSGDGKAVDTDKGIVTPQGTVIPSPPEQKFVGADAIKEQNKNTGETEKTFGAMRGSLEGTEGRIKALADALKVVQSGGLVSHRAEVSNTLRGLGLDKAADAFMNKRETAAVQTAIGLQVLDVLGQLKNINQGTGGRILNSEFVNLIDKQYGPDISPAANRALITQALGGINQTRAMIDGYYKYAKPVQGWRDANAYQSAFYSDPANSYGRMVKDAEADVGLLKGMTPPKRGAAAAPTGSTPGGAAAGSAAPAPPGVGAIMDGYRFNGGDPADKNNWSRTQ